MDIISAILEFSRHVIDLLLHTDVYLDQLVTSFGIWTYLILFLIIFCETGLVVTPFLPGDSLLFAAGAIMAREGSPLNIAVMAVVLIAAAILGDAVNYAIGNIVGPRIFRLENSKFFNRKHLEYTQNFYKKHGGKTIIIARFMPIIRTFAPFVAGMGRMKYRRFAAFNVVGGVTWISIFLTIGYLFGGLEVIKRNFTLVIFAIIIISVLPGAIEVLRHKFKKLEN